MNNTSDLKAVVRHINLIAQGRYDVDFTPLGPDDELGLALCEMTEVLRDMSLENKKSAWIKSGQAEIANIIRGDQEALELGKNIVGLLSRYIDALVGTIYQVAMDEVNALDLIGTFAAQRKQLEQTRVKFGEGLVGQCAVEKELLIFDDVPEDYMMITSGLGKACSKYIIVVPFLIEKELVGVMELGALRPFDATKIELLRVVSENIAIALKSSQNSKKLKILLNNLDNKIC